MQQKASRASVILAAIVLTVAACGGDVDEAATSSSTAAPTASTTPAPADGESTSTYASGKTTSTESSADQSTSSGPGSVTTSATVQTTATAPTTGPTTDSGPKTTAPTIGSSGPVPWTAAPLDLATLPDAYRLEWAEAGQPATCPFLAFADLGPELRDATIRRAENAGEMLVVWDNPDGPGHDRRSEPCDDCGRGVVGLGTFQGGGSVVSQATIAWDDGSSANVDVLPWVYGVSARIQPAGADCIYQLWSHLGYDHVDYLIGQLRQVIT